MSILSMRLSSLREDSSVVDHLCNKLWRSGSVGGCSKHTQRGQSAVDVRPYDDERTRDRTEGIASTGQESNKGTVTHTDYWSGKLSVVDRPATVKVNLREDDVFMSKWAWRNGRWVHRQTGAVLEWQTTASIMAPSVRLASNVWKNLKRSGLPKSKSRNQTVTSLAS